MSSGPNLYCSEGEGGSWVDVRGLVYVLGTGGYNRLLRLLGRAGYEIHRSRSSTWVKGKVQSGRYTGYRQLRRK